MKGREVKEWPSVQQSAVWRYVEQAVLSHTSIPYGTV